ncbi:MAG: hypothetical protein ABIB71_07045 [Candidatus Woesearchaeota archaeon]
MQTATVHPKMKQIQIQGDKTEQFREIINYTLIKKYGSRITLDKIEEINNQRYKVSLNYNKVFHIIDEENKKLFVRNIFFKEIYTKELIHSEDLEIPLNEINLAINNEFVELRGNLFKKVIDNKDVVMRILRKIHPTATFLNKFYIVLMDLLINDILPKSKTQYYLKEENGYKKYIPLIIDSKLAEYDSGKRLKASNKFKRLMEKHNKDYSVAIDEGMFIIIRENYEYIIYELGLRQIKPYINIISVINYLKHNKGLKKVSIKIEEMYKIYSIFFGTIPLETFSDRINYLIVSGVLNKEKDTLRLVLTN